MTDKPKRPAPRMFQVKAVQYITPHMIRVTFIGDMDGIKSGCEGANCKIFLPAAGQSKVDFADELSNGRPTVRTYTVRYFREEAGEMDIDFVAHGDDGPACQFATHAKVGDFIGFRGPSAVKIAAYEADWYLIAGDMSALPIVSATMEAMPRDAKGVAVIEVLSNADRQQIDAPDGIEINWLIQDDPHLPSAAQEAFIRALNWPKDQRIQTCIAGESGVIKSLRGFLHNEKNVPREDTYISGYWKIGLIEDEHQKVKRLEAAQ